MSNTAGKQPHRLKFPYFQHFLFSALLLGDIPEHQDNPDYGAVSVPYGRAAVGKNPFPAVSGDQCGMISQPDNLA
jgi:hypothetical protein